MRPTPGVEWNWAHTHQFEATSLHRPTSVQELHELIETAANDHRSLRVLGSRHSFTSIADADGLLDLCVMPERFEVGPDREAVTVNGAMTYARIAQLLEPEGLALANTASLPHLTIAGAISTATHGSGDGNGNLATAVNALEVATSTGHLRRIERGNADFAATPVALGALGAIVSIELAVEPAFQVEQLVHDDLSWPSLSDTFDAIFGSAYSVSVFTDWCSHLQLWTKRRLDQPVVDHGALHDGVPASAARHPVPGEDASACTAQGPSGLWSHRLPHFRADRIPSTGAEVQSEFFVDRSHAVEAIDRLRGIGSELSDSMMVSEIRTVQRDELWLSPHYERDCVAFHFTWYHDVAAAEQAARRVAHALGPLHPSPHWGKVFDPDQFDLAALYPRLGDACAVFERWDPPGVFTNRWMQTTVGHPRNNS